MNNIIHEIKCNRCEKCEHKEYISALLDKQREEFDIQIKDIKDKNNELNLFIYKREVEDREFFEGNILLEIICYFIFLYLLMFLFLTSPIRENFFSFDFEFFKSNIHQLLEVFND